MSQEICGKTKVTIKGDEFICDNFPQIWEVLEDHDYSIDEDSKQKLIRILFICNRYEYDENLSFEIMWDFEEV